MHWLKSLRDPEYMVALEWWTVLALRTVVILGEGDGTPLQYSCLENPMDGGAWWAAVHGVTKSPA